MVESRFAAVVRANGDASSISAHALLHPIDAPPPQTTPAAPANASSLNPFRTLTERLIRRLYKGVRGELRELTATNVEQVIALAETGVSGSRVELPGQIVAERRFDEIAFFSGAKKSIGPAADILRRNRTTGAPVSYQYQVPRPASGTTTIDVRELNTSLRLKVIDWSQRESDTKRETVALDADLMHFPLVLRNWRPGDAYRPKGHRDERKMKQMLLARRVPAEKRPQWPVLESSGRIIWALGMPPSADFLVSPTTRVGLVIEDADFPDESRK